MRSTRLTAIIGCILALVQAALAVESTVRLRFEIDTLRGFICLQARVNENREPEWFILIQAQTWDWLYNQAQQVA
jgi:hypothetical protein